MFAPKIVDYGIPCKEPNFWIEFLELAVGERLAVLDFPAAVLSADADPNADATWWTVIRDEAQEGLVAAQEWVPLASPRPDAPPEPEYAI
jgi:hypothetical protein